MTSDSRDHTFTATTPVTDVPRLGPTRARRLDPLGITNVGQLTTAFCDERGPIVAPRLDAGVQRTVASIAARTESLTLPHVAQAGPAWLSPRKALEAMAFIRTFGVDENCLTTPADARVLGQTTVTPADIEWERGVVTAANCSVALVVDLEAATKTLRRALGAHTVPVTHVATTTLGEHGSVDAPQDAGRGTARIYRSPRGVLTAVDSRLGHAIEQFTRQRLGEDAPAQTMAHDASSVLADALPGSLLLVAPLQLTDSDRTHLRQQFGATSAKKTGPSTPVVSDGGVDGAY